MLGLLQLVSLLYGKAEEMGTNHSILKYKVNVFLPQGYFNMLY